MAFNIKRTLGEAYNKGVVKARELRDEDQVKKGLKVVVVVERADGKRLLINTYGVKGHVQVDDYDEERIVKFLGHPLGSIRSALKSGNRFTDRDVRVTFDFSAPAKAPSKPFKPIVIKLPKMKAAKRTPVSRLTTPKATKAGYYSATLGRWVN
jgi:phospholipase C